MRDLERDEQRLCLSGAIRASAWSHLSEPVQNGASERHSRYYAAFGSREREEELGGQGGATLSKSLVPEIRNLQSMRKKFDKIVHLEADSPILAPSSAEANEQGERPALAVTWRNWWERNANAFR